MIGDVGAALELLGIAVIFVLAVIGGGAVVVHAYLSVNPYHGRHVRDDGLEVLSPPAEDRGAVWHTVEVHVHGGGGSGGERGAELVGFHLDTGEPVYWRDLATTAPDKIVRL